MSISVKLSLPKFKEANIFLANSKKAPLLASRNDELAQKRIHKKIGWKRADPLQPGVEPERERGTSVFRELPHLFYLPAPQRPYLSFE